LRRSTFHGIFPSLPTIVTSSGEIDEAGQRRVVKFCIESRADGLACLLFAGEFYKFSDAERSRVAEIVVDEANGRVPVLVGISHSGTLPSIQLGLEAIDLGADGLIITPPYHANFVRESSLSIRTHYREVANKLDVPIMIQDYETKDGVHLSASDLERIARSYENIRYVKVEGGNHLKRIQEITELMGRRMRVFGGMAGRYLIDELALGTRGSVPGAEIVDRLTVVYRALKKGDEKLARATFETLLPYLNFLIQHFDSFVSAEKEILKIRGVIISSAVREPAVHLDKPAIAKLRGILEKIDLMESIR
jgi:4-hydroxy-tetrahydrodipicolinate synthase